MNRLELPITIRTTRLDEVPNDPEIVNAILEAGKANIVEGYTLKTDIPVDSLFRFYAEINIDNTRIWNLLISLLAIFPEQISLIFGHIDDDPFLGRYDNKHEVLETVSLYKTELTKDGFLEFGFIYQNEEQLLEIFIKKSKYIQFWGVDIREFLNVMKAYSLYEIEGLKFIDEYPLVTESLSLLFPEAKNTFDVINALEEVFIK